MSFPVVFYVLAKRENSTKIPTGSEVTATYNCVLKGSNSILRPDIVLDYGLTDAPVYNYCYIAKFNRYYFVTEWTWTNNRNWTASLRVDVLATYRSVIGASSLYVLRSASAWNEDLTDTYYPTKTNFTRGSVTPANSYADLWEATDSLYNCIDVQAGCFVVGIVGSNSNSDNFLIGGVEYYIMGWEGMQQIVNLLLYIADQVSISGVTGDAQKLLVDPMQYITSVVWLPFDGETHIYHSLSKKYVQYYTYTLDDNITGVTSSGVQCYTVNKNIYASTFSFQLSLTKHPQISDRGAAWLKMAPYSEYSVFVPPFGLIPLDSAKLYNSTSITIRVQVDPISGAGYLHVEDNNGVMQAWRSAQVGVPIQLVQVTRDLVGSAASLGDGTVRAVGAALTGNIAGAVLEAVGGMWSAAKQAAPQAEIHGSTGNFGALFSGEPALYYQFQILANENLANIGRPYCAVATPSSLGGFMTVENGSLAISGTDAESREIRSYLESGFYYD